MEGKKKRGSNYTTEEKDILLELVKKYQNIIENKETNATIILKKREAWDSICQQYNAVAGSGIRTWQQLRHLYENLKQRSKKNIAQVNRLKYYDNTKDILKKASLDKKELIRTGGGAYTSMLTEQDAQILALVAPQVKPLSNPYDDAAVYFGETEVNPGNQDEIENTSELMANPISIDTPETRMMCHRNNEPSTSTCDLTEQVKKPKQRVTSIKEQYFKAKLRNAKLEFNI